MTKAYDTTIVPCTHDHFDLKNKIKHSKILIKNKKNLTLCYLINF